MLERDKERTRQKIIEALRHLLSQKGIQNLGVNTVAREAKVSKVLIYRYFGSMPELLRAFAQEGGLWPSTEELMGANTNLRRITDIEQANITLLCNFLKEIRRRKLTQEIMRWQLADSNELTTYLLDIRERQRREIQSALPLNAAKYPEIDLGAAMALLHAGLTHMVLSSKHSDEYMGIDLHSNFGWRRLEKAVEELIRGYFDRYRTKGELAK